MTPTPNKHPEECRCVFCAPDPPIVMRDVPATGSRSTESILKSDLKMAMNVLKDGGVSGDGGETQHKFSDTLREAAKKLRELGSVDGVEEWLDGKADDIDAVIAAVEGSEP